MPNNLGISDEEFEKRFDEELNLNSLSLKKAPKTHEERKQYAIQEIEKDIVSLKRSLEKEENAYTLMRRDKQIHNLESLKKAFEMDDGKWTKHTDTYWSRLFQGKRLDYWPSTNKFRIGGKTYYGSPLNLISKQSIKDSYKTKVRMANDWERYLVNQSEV